MVLDFLGMDDGVRLLFGDSIVRVIYLSRIFFYEVFDYFIF